MAVSEVTDHTCARPALCLAYTDLVRRVVPVSVVIRFVILSSERVAAGCRGGCRSIIVFLVELPAVHRSAVVPHGGPRARHAVQTNKPVAGAERSPAAAAPSRRGDARTTVGAVLRQAFNSLRAEGRGHAGSRVAI